MKFSEFPFYRPDIKLVVKEIENFIDKFSAAKSFNEQDEIFMQSIGYCYNFLTLYNIACVRYSTDTLNSAYKADKNYFEDIIFDYIETCNKLDLCLANSAFLKQFEEKYGSYIIKKYLLDVSLYSDEIRDDLIAQEKLENEYYDLRAGAVISFKGKEYSLRQMEKFDDSSNREERKNARDEIYKLYGSWRLDINTLFDKLVKTRTEISHKLGFKNFVELGYASMDKEFSYLEAQKFRGHIKKYVVHLVLKLKERQQKRIGVDKLMYYDLGYRFNTGNPVPKGDADWVLQQLKKTFSELSSETKEFIEFMIENELISIASKIGKAGGGYMTYFDTYRCPFIFSNFIGTAGDIETLIHEAGHAFQAYICKDFRLREEMNATKDVDEVHSMAMELLTLDYMNLFFEEDTEKFLFSQIDDSLRAILINCIRDEFQEKVYLNPGLTIEERIEVWKELQQEYKIGSAGQGSEFLDSGCSWHMNGHIFGNPFYSLEYALAQIVAYRFLFLKKENHEAAMKKYIDFCKLGGRYTFSESLKIAGLENPFEEETVRTVTEKVEGLLEEIDDSKF
ncbi:MAG: M3 family oligoendopeptidase [Ignavibacteria bacterium]|nr:M3 family oligoendopeptidase [Ignavibacteria bacterium]